MVRCNHLCSGLDTAFALYVKQQQLLFYLLKTSALVYLHSVREEEPLIKWRLLDDERCTCPVPLIELVNMDGSLETFDYYRHALTPPLQYLQISSS